MSSIDIVAARLAGNYADYSDVFEVVGRLQDQAPGPGETLIDVVTISLIPAGRGTVLSVSVPFSEFGSGGDLARIFAAIDEVNALYELP